MENFVIKYNSIFKNENNYRIVFDMGGDITNEKERIKSILKKYELISEYLFKNKKIFLAITCWKNKQDTFSDLDTIGFDYNSAESIKYKQDYSNVVRFLNIEPEDEIIYLEFDSFKFDLLRPLIKGIAGFELALDDSIGARMYLITFEKKPVLLNLYDDRGMECIVTTDELNEKIKKRFSNWVLDF